MLLRTQSLQIKGVLADLTEEGELTPPLSDHLLLKLREATGDLTPSTTIDLVENLAEGVEQLEEMLHTPVATTLSEMTPERVRTATSVLSHLSQLRTALREFAECCLGKKKTESLSPESSNDGQDDTTEESRRRTDELLHSLTKS